MASLASILNSGAHNLNTGGRCCFSTFPTRALYGHWCQYLKVSFRQLHHSRNTVLLMKGLHNCLLRGVSLSLALGIAQPAGKLHTNPIMAKWGVYHSQEECLKILEEQASSNSQIQELIKIFKNHCKSDNFCLNEERKNHPFIVIEGLDGSGKSTMSKLIAKRIGGVKMSSPGQSFLHLRPFFDNQPNHIRRAFYSLSNYAAAFEIDEILKERPVVLDRFWHSTAAYSIAGQVNDISELPVPKDPVYMWPKDLKPHPDVVIFLKVNEAERLRRFRGRNTTNTAEEVRLANESNYRLVLHEAYKRMYEPGITEVDASRPNVKAVANHVVDLIQEHVKDF